MGGSAGFVATPRNKARDGKAETKRCLHTTILARIVEIPSSDAGNEKSRATVARRDIRDGLNLALRRVGITWRDGG